MHMEKRAQLFADTVGRIMGWDTQPALRDGRIIGGPRPPQVAARTLAYVAGTMGTYPP
jgi:hypothetical protein